MGLDMYAFKKTEQVVDTNFERPEDSTEISSWWKHPNLHGWMEELYREKNGGQAVCDCATVRLDLADLDALQEAVEEGNLPVASGFFPCDRPPEDRDLDLALITKAREAITDGFVVFYSWW